MANITTVKFDDVLKNVFDRARLELKNEVELLSLHQEGLHLQEKAQSRIREWLVEHINEINYIDCTKKQRGATLPNMFALMCGVMSNYKNKQNWTEVMGDYDSVNGLGIDVKEGDEISFIDISGGYYSIVKCFCACGHTIHNLFELKSTPNNVKLILGCDCIHKCVILNPQLKKSFDEAKKKIKEMKKYRMCDDCKQMKIEKTEPKRKTRCMSCWIKFTKQQQINNRQCGMCGYYRIHCNEPSWKKVCVSCYIKNKKI